MATKSLTGIKQITVYTQRSWGTIQLWIENDKFPARKLDGVWESMPELIDEWKRNRITSQEATVND